LDTGRLCWPHTPPPGSPGVDAPIFIVLFPGGCQGDSPPWLGPDSGYSFLKRILARDPSECGTVVNPFLRYTERGRIGPRIVNLCAVSGHPTETDGTP
jgi:hypothetical protein